MREVALFINGVYESALREVVAIQQVLPEQIMFLQPHGSRYMKELRADPPSVDDPMRLFISPTVDLSRVHYEAEIVGWDDKAHLSAERRGVLERVVNALQPGEHGIYDLAHSPNGVSVNLLHVRRMRQLDTPMDVGQLVKTKDG